MVFTFNLKVIYMKGGRKASPWNLFVKKVYNEGHSRNAGYSFKQALRDASRRKGEMRNMMGTQKNFSNNQNMKTKRNRRGTRSRRNR